MASWKLCNEGSAKSFSFSSCLLLILILLFYQDWGPTPFYSINLWPQANPNLYHSPKPNLSSNPNPSPSPKPNPILYPSQNSSPSPSPGTGPGPSPSPGLNWTPAEEIVEEDVSSAGPVVPPDEAAQQEIKERITNQSQSQRLDEERTATKTSWVQKIELDLLTAKEAILKTSSEYHTDLSPSIYHNVSQFAKSYELMELIFKVFVYKEGSNPFVHVGPTKGIYASEGWFIRGMQRRNQFVTRDPYKAHAFYLPYSVASLVNHLYVPDSHSMLPISTFARNYVNTIAAKHPFWNRTRGGDHFFVSCHDWAPATARSHWELAHNAMNVVCNADLTEGYVVGKDVSLPEIPVHSAKLKLHIGGAGPEKRPFLAFFAGRMHGRVRPTLLHCWKDKDSDMRIYEELPSSIAKSLPYAQHMRMSRFCLCPMGYEVNSPRIVEAIYYDCVPVIIADGFVLPFGDVLKWDAFSITVAERDISNLKKILLGVPHEKYVSMQRNLKAVRQHFMWHLSPVRYDAFHMILHSIWSRRLLRAEL